MYCQLRGIAERRFKPNRVAFLPLPALLAIFLFAQQPPNAKQSALRGKAQAPSQAEASRARPFMPYNHCFG